MVCCTGVVLDTSGRILAGVDDCLPFQTGHPQVFAGGDNMRGADLVVRAVHDEREAAKSIAQLLSCTTQSQRQQPACA